MYAWHSVQPGHIGHICDKPYMDRPVDVRFTQRSPMDIECGCVYPKWTGRVLRVKARCSSKVTCKRAIFSIYTCDNRFFFHFFSITTHVHGLPLVRRSEYGLWV